MSMLRRVRHYLGWKLFLSYLVVILVGMIVLLSAAEFVMPSAFERHLAAMAAMMGSDTMLADDLFDNFRAAVTEALALAAGVLAPVGCVLSPAVGALLMSLNTVIIAVNAQLLRRARWAA